MYDAVLSETVTITGHEGDPIEAYSARPLKPGPAGGVVVIHHLPGYDRQSLFGSEDKFPSPEHVAELQAALVAAGKTNVLRIYEGANHGFMQVDSARYHRKARWTPGGRSSTGSAVTWRPDGRSCKECVLT
jgi:dienelactone hydrolase